MAVNAELFLLPYFFSSKQDPTFPFYRLLQPDSVLENLMDDWKEEAIMENYQSKLHN